MKDVIAVYDLPNRDGNTLLVSVPTYTYPFMTFLTGMETGPPRDYPDPPRPVHDLPNRDGNHFSAHG